LKGMKSGARPTPRQIEHMLDGGRISEEDAQRLRSGDEAERALTLRQIRARHVRERLAALVADGLLESDEAAGLVERAASEVHDPAVRRRVTELMRQASAPSREAQ
jgi:hypothetical protein